MNFTPSIPGIDANTDLMTFTIKADGTDVTNSIKVLSIAVQKEVNKIASARIVVSDGDVAEQDFPTSSADYFVPGNEIEIEVGYHSDEKTVFKGIVIKHNLRIREGSTRLYIECKDETFKTTIARKNRLFEETTDSDAIETILGEYGLKKDVSSTTVQHQELVQYNATDWDFIMSRADANALVCLVDDGKVTFEKPSLTQSAVLECTFGINIYEFDAEMDARKQYDGTVAKSWDFASQELAEADGIEPAFSGTGNLSTRDLSGNLDQPTYELFHSGQVKTDELQAWADSKLLHSRLAQVLGRVKIQGTADVVPGDMIELKGVGDRFNGKVYVSGIHHQMTGGNWTTNIQFGLQENWCGDIKSINAPSASGLLPAFKGLQNGVVTQIEEDPEGEERIKVRFPIVDPTAEGIWCRLACLDAGNERGTFFRPEVDDEVIVGFVNNDPRDGVVLGMLHSSTRPSPEPIAAENFKKGYLSREKLRWEFDDELLIIKMETPGGNSIVLDEDLGGIKLEDQNGNKIVMDADGILIESAKDINIKATGDLSGEAINISLSAQSGFKSEGSASSEISSGGTTTVKGSMVQIN